MQSQILKEEFHKKSIGYAIYSIIKDFIDKDTEIIRISIRKALDEWENISGESVSLICEVGPKERIAIMNHIFPLIEKYYFETKNIQTDELLVKKFEQSFLNYVGLETNPMVNCHSLLCNQIIGK
ncbi:MAG: hypothetical protein ACW99A_11510 [Candidatus Kariarchaeaceae archaeon]|jgi:hypothetical protein